MLKQAHLMLLMTASSLFASQKTDQAIFLSPSVLKTVLTAAKLQNSTDTTPNAQQAYQALNTFFATNGINDYADAAKFGAKTPFVDDADAFNAYMSHLFIQHSEDQCPLPPKKYQAVLLGTSGIDVFTERLAFLARLKKSGMQTESVVALVGAHAHRKDLMNPEYLVKLAQYFNQDFDLTNYNEQEVLAKLAVLLKKENWTHKDGMQAAWQLVACDESMAELATKFKFHPDPIDPALRTEQLMEHFLEHGLSHPISEEHPIAFVCNAQGAPKTKEMVTKIFGNSNVDVLVAKPVADEVESKIFNDTPSQRAMVKLFHFYRILEAITK